MARRLLLKIRRREREGKNNDRELVEGNDVKHKEHPWEVKLKEKCQYSKKANSQENNFSAMAKMVDPSAPRPEGNLMTPVRGDSAAVNGSTLPRSVDRLVFLFFLDYWAKDYGS